MTGASSEARPCYQFGAFLLDSESRTLFQQRVVVHTSGKMIPLLQALLEKPGQVVDKYELLEILWPNQDVSDWSLSRLVSDTRQALGDDARDQMLIQTVRGQGFRINPDIAVSMAETPDMFTKIVSRSPHKGALAVVAVIGLLIVGFVAVQLQTRNDEMPRLGDERRIVILPVRVGTGDDQDSWVQYGVMTMLAGQLRRFSELQVADVESTINALEQIEFKLAEQNDDALFQQICVPLGCRQAIATELGLSANGIPQLTYTLHTRDGRSSSFSFENEDILQASNLLFEHLLSRLLPPEPERVNVDSMYTDDPRVNQNFALGASSVLRGDSQSAIRYLSMALEQSPEFFWAKAYMADALTRMGEFERARVLIDEIAESATDARQLLHLAKLRSNISYNRGELNQSIVESEKMLRLAIESNDKEAEGVALMHMGTTSQSLGKNHHAIRHLTNALELFREQGFELHQSKTTFNLGNAHYTLEDFDQAERYYVEAADMFRRQGSLEWLSYVQYALAALRSTQGRLDLAETEFRELEKLYRSTGEVEGLLLVRGELGVIEIQRGNPRGAEPLLLEAYEGAGDTYRYVRSWASGLLAICYLNAGEPDKARPFVEERERYDWFEPRVPMVFVAASLAHADGDYASAVKLALQAQDRVGAQWSDDHAEWLRAFQVAARTGERVISDYYHLRSD